jgi:probable RNA-binding protein EIF1AD
MLFQNKSPALALFGPAQTSSTFILYITEMPKPRRKVQAEALLASTPPETLPPSHVIARVVTARGSELFAVKLSSSEAELLVELSSKLRRTVFLRRGGYVLVDRDALNTERDNKLGGVIVGVVLDERQWRKMTYW